MYCKQCKILLHLLKDVVDHVINIEGLQCDFRFLFS
jgi:hypothetical protein